MATRSTQQHVLTGVDSFRFRRESDGARITLTKGEAIEPHARITELPTDARRLFTRQATPAPDSDGGETAVEAPSAAR